jgi:hypothetical protein
VNQVINRILESGLEAIEDPQRRLDAQGDQPTDILADVEQVEKTLKTQAPQISYDANEIYALLENNAAREDRVQHVLTLLKSRVPQQNQSNTVIVIPDNSASSSHTGDTMTKKVPPAKSENDDLVKALLKDAQTLHQIFSAVSVDELYAYLEAHHDADNRIDIVMNELMERNEGNPQLSDKNPTQKMDNNTQAEEESPKQSNGSSASLSLITTTRSQNADVDALVLSDVETLLNLFPECDPNYLYDQLLLKRTSGDVAAANSLSMEMFEKRNFPKLKDRLEKEEKENRKQQLQNLQFKVDEFLEMFPDPKAYFYDEARPVNESYTRHTTVMLSNSFPMLKQGPIKKAMDSHKGHFLPTYRELEKVAAKYNGGILNLCSFFNFLIFLLFQIKLFNFI